MHCNEECLNAKETATDYKSIRQASVELKARDKFGSLFRFEGVKPLITRNEPEIIPYHWPIQTRWQSDFSLHQLRFGNETSCRCGRWSLWTLFGSADRRVLQEQSSSDSDLGSVFPGHNWRWFCWALESLLVQG